MKQTCKFSCYYHKGAELKIISEHYIECGSENEMRVAAVGMLIGLSEKYKTGIVFSEPTNGYNQGGWVGYQVSSVELNVRPSGLDPVCGQFAD